MSVTLLLTAISDGHVSAHHDKYTIALHYDHYMRYVWCLLVALSLTVLLDMLLLYK
jgi:hypothetical protein